MIESVATLGLTATLALDFFVLSTTLVAVTVTFVLLLTVGAENIPLLETVPEVADHVTPVLLLPCTRALNCWLLPECKATGLGETVTLMLGPEGLTVTYAWPLLVGSARLVAVTVTTAVLETLGAVK